VKLAPTARGPAAVTWPTCRRVAEPLGGRPREAAFGHFLGKEVLRRAAQQVDLQALCERHCELGE